MGPEAEAESLIGYLSRRYRHSTGAEWLARVESGQVLLDGARAHPDAVLRRGQTLVWRRPPWDEPEAPLSFAILMEDEDVLAVAKPAGLPTLPGGGFLQATLLHRVRAHAPDAAPLHRLGRWTSGVVLFARSRRARSALSVAWAKGEIAKWYRALAVGNPSESGFTIRVPIGPVPYVPLGALHAASATGKPAESRVVVVERRADTFLADVRILTGRPHQIRIHLAAAGHPLVGDPVYVSGGVPASHGRALPGDPGYHLHAADLTFRHPGTGRKVTVRCAPPPLLRPSAG